MKYLYKSDAQDMMRALGTELTNDISDAQTVFSELLEEDDWSFVIKAHALIESSVAELLITALDDPRLDSYIRKLPLANEATGKLGLAKRLDLIDPRHATCIKQLSTVRNLFAHDLGHIGTTLKSYLDGLEDTDYRRLRDAVLWCANHDDKTRDFWRDVFKAEPKTAYWLSVFIIVAILNVTRHQRITEKRLDAAVEKTTADLLADL